MNNERDSHTISLWQSASASRRPRSFQGTENHFDVVVVGGGITGLSTALLLQRAGLRCLLAEARHIGFGTSSATTAHLNTLLDTHYVDIIRKFGQSAAERMAQGARQAINLIADLVQQHSMACDFKMQDGFLFSENEQQTRALAQIVEGMRKVKVEVSYASQIPVPIPFDHAVRVPGQASIHPVCYLKGMARVFESEGGVLLEETRVGKDKVRKKGDHLVVATAAGAIETKNVVYATHIPPGLNILNLECTPYRSYVLAAQLEEDAYPQGLVYDMREPYHYFRTAVVDQVKYLVVGGADHQTGSVVHTESRFEELEAYLRRYYKLRSVDFKWSAQYYEPADGLPYVGHLPGAPGQVYVATGFSGVGMTLGALSAKILTQLITTGESEFKSLLSPSRIRPVAGFKKGVAQTAATVKHFIGDRLAAGQEEEIGKIRPGEGKIINLRGEKRAVYKADNGKLTVLSAVCPHAKCLVQWNNGEKSWDCPCHGSRFDTGGRVLNGPALHGLHSVPADES